MIIDKDFGGDEDRVQRRDFHQSMVESAIFGVRGEGAPERFSPNHPHPFHSQLTALLVELYCYKSSVNIW
eukprot:scaffold3546_cov138-Chaetoceros_neogracile.AAC.1